MTTTTATAKRLYKVCTGEDDIARAKMNINRNGYRLSIDMDVSNRKTVEDCYKVFCKAFNQAVEDGVIPAELAPLAAEFDCLDANCENGYFKIEFDGGIFFEAENNDECGCYFHLHVPNKQAADVEANVNPVTIKEETKMTNTTNEMLFNAIEEYATSNAALNIATNAEIDNAIAEIKRDIEDIISERDEAFDELDIAEANEDIAQWVIDNLKETIDEKLDEYNVCEMMIARLEDSRPDDDNPDTPDNPDNPDNNPPDDIMKKYKDVCWIIKHRIAKNGRHMWFAHTGIIGKAEAAERLNKWGLTIEQYLAAEEQEKAQWEVERELSLKAYLHARHIEEKNKILVEIIDEYAISNAALNIAINAEIDNAIAKIKREIDDIEDAIDSDRRDLHAGTPWYPRMTPPPAEELRANLTRNFIKRRDCRQAIARLEESRPVDDTPDNNPPSVDNNGYIFTVYCNDIRRVEARDTKCAILGDDNHFDNSVFREVTFYNKDNLGWELKTANGDIIIKGNDAPDFAKILAAVKTPAADNSFEKTFAADFDNNGNCHVELNGEHVQISNGKLSYVKAPRYNLAFDPDKKRFTYLGRVIAKSKVATIINNKNLAIDQRDKLREFFRPYIHSNGAFEFLISIDYCDDSDSNFGARFDTYEQAYDFAKNVDIMLKKFAGVKSFARIRIASNRELIYERDSDGNKFWTLSNESANYLAAAADNPNLPAPVFTADIDDDNRTFIGQDGTKFIAPGDAVNISTKGTNLTINGRPVANYQTIKAALAAADYVYYFAKEIDDDNFLPEFDYDPDEPDTVFDNRNKRDRSKQTIYLDPPQSLVDVATRINKLNLAAPHGWEIIFDSDNKLFAVEFNEKPVATLDSLALTKLLTPEEFFSRYAPLINPAAAQKNFVDEREAEIAQLQAMKADLGNDAERLKILDDLIADNQREISATINAG